MTTTPACFDSAEQYRLWRQLLALTRHDRSICADCTRDYRRLMQAEGRCHPAPSRADPARQWVEEYERC